MIFLLKALCRSAPGAARLQPRPGAFGFADLTRGFDPGMRLGDSAAGVQPSGFDTPRLVLDEWKRVGVPRGRPTLFCAVVFRGRRWGKPAAFAAEKPPQGRKASPRRLVPQRAGTAAGGAGGRIFDAVRSPGSRRPMRGAAGPLDLPRFHAGGVFSRGRAGPLSQFWGRTLRPGVSCAAVRPPRSRLLRAGCGQGVGRARVRGDGARA